MLEQVMLSLWLFDLMLLFLPTKTFFAPKSTFTPQKKETTFYRKKVRFSDFWWNSSRANLTCDTHSQNSDPPGRGHGKNGRLHFSP